MVRLKKNYEAMNELRSGYEEQRKYAHSIESDSSPNANERNLSDIRRLTLQIQQDIENELMEIE